jgi:ribosomal protein L37E
MNPNKFKYKVMYKGEFIYGNSVDAIANFIASDPNSSHTFSSASLLVSKNIIPVSKAISEQSFPSKSVKKKNKSLKEVSDGAAAALKQIGGITVPQSEINRRAIICSRCTNKSEVSGCRSCGFGKALVKFVNNVKKAFGGGVSIPNGLEGNYCNSCDCSLAMMLPASIEDFSETTRKDESRPKECWVRL